MADEHHRLGCYQYEAFGHENYNACFQNYVQNLSETYFWADADWGKPGMEFAEPQPEHKRLSPHLVSIRHQFHDYYDHVQAQLVMLSECVQVNGAPRDLQIDYKFYKNRKQAGSHLG
ncbi:DUF5054 domain-containing protein [Paenibacillus aceris]|uniref:Uncharacterized protein n=1 Tax=Paenibacillus aceris TaxID=869555 RepID=A0ABS4IAF2_9BACL|nr:hypothetical protein [Paenibacillus aceris]